MEEKKCCTPEEIKEERQKKFNEFMKNRAMKEHLVAPKPSSSALFYQQNHVNKTLTLPFFRCKNKENCGSRKDYPCRTGECFPETGPLAGKPMVHRTKYSARPASPHDVALPTHRTLHDTYTLKLDKRFLRKD